MDSAKAAVVLLKKLIREPSFSGDENRTAGILETELRSLGFNPNRFLNNVWAVNPQFDPQKPTLLLNSHHDTVKPGNSWSYPPHEATVSGDKIIGLGSNDAGASLASLLYVFAILSKEELPFNLLFLASAEEETAGPNGVTAVLPKLPEIAFGIVGEPTEMKMAIAEKGLLVLDCTAKGKTGHAARGEGDNAIYKAIKDIQWLQSYTFPKISEVLGTVHVCVTQITGGSQHNVVPDQCTFVADVRTNDLYTNEEILRIIQKHLQSDVKARSLRLRSSSIALNHPLVKSGLSLGLPYFGSATMSDQVHMPFPTLKIGPGKSERSHTPNEFILSSEIEQAILIYINLLKNTYPYG